MFFNYWLTSSLVDVNFLILNLSNISYFNGDYGTIFLFIKI